MTNQQTHPKGLRAQQQWDLFKKVCPGADLPCPFPLVPEVLQGCNIDPSVALMMPLFHWRRGAGSLQGRSWTCPQKKHWSGHWLPVYFLVYLCQAFQSIMLYLKNRLIHIFYLMLILLIPPRYANYCGLESPCDDIHTVLDKFSHRIGALQKGEPHPLPLPHPLPVPHLF